VVKLASSFYQNALQGLPSSNGFMAVVSARNGVVLALLHDQGQLTEERTALAGALAARVIVRAGSRTLGIVGAGVQARMQAEALSRLPGIDTILLHARNPQRAEALAVELGAESVDLETLCARADLIVTTTPSTAPLLLNGSIRPGTRIVAIGADSPGKQELDPMILARACVIVDSREQCVDHGEAGWAVRAGLIEADALIELGTLLASPRHFEADQIVVVDMTGVAVLDVAIAESVWRRLAV
jgi:ornithine cyclodeaminase